MVEFIIGDYDLKDGDEIVTDFFPDIVYKTALNLGKTFILFAEDLRLSDSDIDFIAKNTTGNVKVVASSKKALGKLRKNKNITITYTSGFVEAMSPFQLADSVLKCKDRNYLFEWMKVNKPNLFIVVKSLVSAYMDLKPRNQAAVAWLDMNLFKSNPEFIYAFLAFHFELDTGVKYLKWNYPKKEEKE